MKNTIARFGKFLSAMVMPNIGAFIAWGFITALFIENGWFPNAQLASIQPFMLTFLLPVLIAAQGGKMVGGDRGRVMGAIAVMGCIAGVGGTDGQPMLMGAMIMGPLAGFVIKKFDQAMDGRMPAGFEMLINNFSVGILGMVMAILGYYAIGPVMSAILAFLSAGVNLLVQHSLLPLVSIFLEPAKVLFLWKPTPAPASVSWSHTGCSPRTVPPRIRPPVQLLSTCLAVSMRSISRIS